MQEKAWPEKVWGQGHFDKNARTCPISCPVSSNFFQARPGHFQLSILFNSGNTPSICNLTIPSSIHHHCFLNLVQLTSSRQSKAHTFTFVWKQDFDCTIYFPSLLPSPIEKIHNNNISLSLLKSISQFSSSNSKIYKNVLKFSAVTETYNKKNYLLNIIISKIFYSF